MVERHTRFTVLVKVNSKRTDEVVPALIEKMKGLPGILKGLLLGIEESNYNNIRSSR